MTAHPASPPDDRGAAAASAAGFETAMAELERIVAEMESGRLSLEQSLEAWRRGSALLQTCQRILDDARQQVEILENGLLQPFQNGNGPHGQ